MPPLRTFVITQTREIRISASEVLDAAGYASKLLAGETAPEGHQAQARGPIVERKLVIEEQR